MADKLTDAEIVEELKRFNETVKLPIDRRKRPLLIKKINHHRAREAAANNPKKTPNTRKKQNLEFSSEEESEDESSLNASTSRLFGRRPKRQSTSAYYSNTNTIEISPSDSRTNLRSRRGIKAEQGPSSEATTPKQKAGGNLYPDLSSLKQAVAPKSDGWNFRRGHKNNSDISYDYHGEFTDSDPDESLYEVENKSINTTFTLTGGPDLGEDNDDAEEEEDNGVYGYVPRVPQKPKTRSSVKSSYSKSTNIKKRVSSNHVPVNSFTEEEIRQQGFQTYDDSRKPKPPVASYISTGILIIVGVFFLSLAATYGYMRRDLFFDMMSNLSSNSKDSIRHTFVNCKDDAKVKDCYSEKEYEASLELVRELEKIISSSPSTESDSTKPRKMKKKDLQDEAKGLKNIDKNKFQKHFNGSIDLIFSNPSWNIRSFDKSGRVANSIADIDVLEADPELSFLTRIFRALYKILVGFMLLLSCIVFLMICVWVWRHHQKSVEEERKKVFDMVEQIIDIIKDNHEAHQQDSQLPPYMAVQHLRDHFLVPSMRKTLLPIWNKAVEFIEANESRIRQETQTIQGEDFLVWKWLPVNTTNANGGKVWQGQAFGENNASSGNTLHYSPTPCLKIRNMFDADMETEEEWEVNIQDAILEKCKNITGILHIHVDRTSREGCVYMKCDSCETAYQVYRALHGWWFDGRLVTVKYLRLELYHDRFPTSQRCTKALKPSNNMMSSLAQPFHRSSLEMT